MSFAFVSLITSDEYLPGAICLSKSLKSKYPLIILAVPEKLSTVTVNALYEAYDSVIFVPEIKSNQFPELDLLGRRDLNSTLTKIHCFNSQIIKYDRICFLDADILVLEDIDRIFEYLDDPEVMFAAAPDVGWPDCFNSGVFVTRPRPSLFLGLLDMKKRVGSFDGGDQGLLNSYFSSWSGHAKTKAPKSVRLPFTYNVTPTAFYSYLPAFAEFNDKICCVHFIGKEKPWNYERFADGGVVPRYVRVLILEDQLRPRLFE